jgi:dTDP-4-dehydrorhamnose 3,5-epimerase
MAQRTRILHTSRIASRNKEGKPNGCVISLYKDWEGEFKAEPRQVYLNICNPGESKGPHLHMKRWSYFGLIRGSMRFVLKYGEGDYEEIDLHAGGDVRIIEVPPALPCLMINAGPEEAWVICMLNPAWHPEHPDDAPVSYDDYVGTPLPAERNG